MKLPAPVDAHVHFRQGQMLRNVVPYHDRVFEHALAMPNTEPPILTGEDARRYKRELHTCCTRMRVHPLIKLTRSTTPMHIVAAKQCGVLAAKLYPEGVTTNSDDGLSWGYLHSKAFGHILAAMSDHGIVLCVHGEKPGSFSMDRERDFLPFVRYAVKAFPSLRITLEHVTDSRSLDYVYWYPNVAATITLHHLELTLDDVIGDKLRPHNFCKPIAKTPNDREALLAAVRSGHPRIMFGSDSAPHVQAAKERDCGCAGCFTAPYLLEGLAELLSPATLACFASLNARAWYKLPPPSYEVELVEDSWRVPDECCGVVPQAAGRTMRYRAFPI